MLNMTTKKKYEMIAKAGVMDNETHIEFMHAVTGEMAELPTTEQRAALIPITETVEEMIENARGLMSDRGENYEYDRALCELICEYAGWGIIRLDFPEVVDYRVLGRALEENEEL